MLLHLHTSFFSGSRSTKISKIAFWASISWAFFSTCLCIIDPVDDSKRVFEGDEKNAAFESLNEANYMQIRSYLISIIGNREIAEDLTQDTFLKATKKVDSLRNKSSLIAWLKVIAKNTWRDYLRKSSKQSEIQVANEELMKFEELWVEGPDSQFEAKELLKEALAKLPATQRNCIILYHLRQYSIRDVANLLGIKESSVRTYLSSGLKRLQEMPHGTSLSEEERSN